MAPKESKQSEQIPITSLSPQELVNLRDRVQADFEAMAENSMQLQRLITHFNATSRAIETLADSKEGQPVMLPLTGSLYVQGKVADPGKVLVDIGTGYYVEMTSSDGTDYCRRKMLKLKDQLDMVNKVVHEKKAAVMQISAVLQDKVSALKQQQQAAAGAAASAGST